MLSRAEMDRVRALTGGPTMRTLRGVRRRLSLLDWRDLHLLCRFYGCDAATIEGALWEDVRPRHPGGRECVPAVLRYAAGGGPRAAGLELSLLT